MQTLVERLYENKPLMFAAAVIAFLIAALLLLVIIRMLFGGRLRMPGGRARQARLGVVDAFDLDRQRQLIIVRRDNTEHLIMIGGPNDVLIESEIVRVEAREGRRDKEAVQAPALTVGFAGGEPRIPAPLLAERPEAAREPGPLPPVGADNPPVLAPPLPAPLPTPIPAAAFERDIAPPSLGAAQREPLPTDPAPPPRAPTFPLPPRRPAPPVPSRPATRPLERAMRTEPAPPSLDLPEVPLAPAPLQAPPAQPLPAEPVPVEVAPPAVSAPPPPRPAPPPFLRPLPPRVPKVLARTPPVGAPARPNPPVPAPAEPIAAAPAPVAPGLAPSLAAQPEQSTAKDTLESLEEEMAKLLGRG